MRTKIKKTKNLPPALAELVKLLARQAVEDYFHENDSEKEIKCEKK